MGKQFHIISTRLHFSPSYKVYEVQHQNDLQGMLLKSLEHNDYDFWSEIRKPGYPTTIMVSPGEQSSFEAFLVKYGIPYRTTIEDVEKALANETARQAAAPRPRKGRISFQAYNTVPEVSRELSLPRPLTTNAFLDRSVSAAAGKRLP